MLQDDPDQWLLYYNTERPHRAYWNRGQRPLDTVLEFAEPARYKCSLYKSYKLLQFRNVLFLKFEKTVHKVKDSAVSIIVFP